MEYIDSDDVNDYMLDIPNMLCDYLSGYLNKIQNTITIQEENLLFEEVFSYDGFLGLFLFAEEKNIEAFVDYLNKTVEDKHSSSSSSFIKSYIKIVFWKESKSLCEVSVGIEHNLNKEESRNFIVYLAQKILSNKNIEVKDEKIKIDSLYNNFAKEINEIIEQEIKINDFYRVFGNTIET